MRAFSCGLLLAAGWIGVAGALLGPGQSMAHAGPILINFDNLGAGQSTGTHYLPLGVMFFRGNGIKGTSTGLAMNNGVPITAIAGYFPGPTSVNVLLPGDAMNNDIFVHFFDGNQQRTFANYVEVQNDLEGFPKVHLEAFDASGTSLGKTGLLAAAEVGSLSFAQIWYAKIWANPLTPGNLGVDNFRFEIADTTVPEPSTFALVACAVGALALGAAKSSRLRRQRLAARS